MIKEIRIKKVIYEEIKNLHADDNSEIIHYVVDYENGNYEGYINIDIQSYVLNPPDEKIYEVYKEYINNGFFIYDMDYNSINNFKNEYDYLFKDDLIDDLYEIIDRMHEVINYE